MVGRMYLTLRWRGHEEGDEQAQCDDGPPTRPRRGAPGGGDCQSARPQGRPTPAGRRCRRSRSSWSRARLRSGSAAGVASRHRRRRCGAADARVRCPPRTRPGARSPRPAVQLLRRGPRAARLAADRPRPRPRRRWPRSSAIAPPTPSRDALLVTAVAVLGVAVAAPRRAGARALPPGRRAGAAHRAARTRWSSPRRARSSAPRRPQLDGIERSRRGARRLPGRRLPRLPRARAVAARAGPRGPAGRLVYDVEDDAAIERWNVPGTPFVVALGDGIAVAKGTVNTLEEIEGCSRSVGRGWRMRRPDPGRPRGAPRRRAGTRRSFLAPRRRRRARRHRRPRWSPPPSSRRRRSRSTSAATRSRPAPARTRPPAAHRPPRQAAADVATAGRSTTSAA